MTRGTATGLIRLCKGCVLFFKWIDKMASGGKRPKAGRKAIGGRVAVLVRLDREIEQKIERLRNGKSMSSTVERLLRTALSDAQTDDDRTNKALGFIVSQAAHAAGWQDRTWLNDPSTKRALELAVPLIIDLLAAGDGKTDHEPHPMFGSVDEHAKQIFFWILNRLKERGDEYGTGWPADHPLRNFPKAAAALNFKVPKFLGGDK